MPAGHRGMSPACPQGAASLKHSHCVSHWPLITIQAAGGHELKPGLEQQKLLYISKTDKLGGVETRQLPQHNSGENAQACRAGEGAEADGVAEAPAWPQLFPPLCLHEQSLLLHGKVLHKSCFIHQAERN